MRIYFALVLALCGTFMISVSPASAQSETAAATSPAAAAQPTAANAPAGKSLLNLNTATIEQLETLPGIGRKTAERIIEFRTKAGKFQRIEELMNVKGIGEKSFLKLKPLIVVPPPKPEKAPGE